MFDSRTRSANFPTSSPNWSCIMQDRRKQMLPAISLWGWIALVCFITFFVQKMVLLVEALNILLSGIWYPWIVWGLRVNLQWCGSIDVTQGMILTLLWKLQGWRKILHLIFSLNRDDNMPLSLKCTSDAIFWMKKLIKHTSAIQPIKDVFGCYGSAHLRSKTLFGCYCWTSLSGPFEICWTYRVSHPIVHRHFRLKWGILRPAGGPVLQQPTTWAGFRDARNSLKLSQKISTHDGMGNSVYYY